MERKVKLVMVGDKAVGKTCLLSTYAHHEIPRDYIPTLFDLYRVTVRVADTEILLDLRDNAGQEDLENIRVLSYTNTDVFLICYSLSDPTSLMNVQQIWIPELTKYVRKPRFILVGTKKDLRNHDETRFNLAREGRRPIDPAEGEAKAIEIGASDYVECSVMDWAEVKEVFDCALWVALSHRQGKKKRCNVA
jgi:small GTP-binding protein